MEHFLPLAIASMVISLISIILLDYFGPTTLANPEQNQIADQKETSEPNVLEENISIDETKVEITAESTKPVNSVVSKTKNNSHSFYSTILKNGLSIGYTLAK